MKLFRQITPFAITILAFTLIFISCDVTDTADERTGRFAVQLTDAPADYDAVFIEIVSVKVKAEEPVAEEVDEEGWITISEETDRVNLLELQNGETILLGEEELEAGFYHQIRLILGDDNAVVIDGETFPLKTPSAQQSGLKLNINAEVEAGEVYVLLLDFNAAKSIVNAGKSGKFLLNPVIRTVELGETGSVEGVVQPDTFETTVLAIADGDTLTTFTEDDGSFRFIGVLPNTYDFVFKPQNEAFADTVLTDIIVEVDEDVDLGTITLSEE